MQVKPFTVPAPSFSNRRLMDRRQSLAPVHRFPNLSVPLGVVLPLVAALALLTWQWSYVRHAPVWLARAYLANRSDLDLGSTNGIRNTGLIEQARLYLSDVDDLKASGKIIGADDLDRQGTPLDMKWFKRHAPESVTFNPFISSDGRFVVTWLYVPGGQKFSRTGMDWHNVRGEPLHPVCTLSVLMAPDLRLTSILLGHV